MPCGAFADDCDHRAGEELILLGSNKFLVPADRTGFVSQGSYVACRAWVAIPRWSSASG